MSTIPASTPMFRNDVQGTRGFSFILVFLYHLYPVTFSSGFVGVDIFFVISGYVITSSLLRSQYLSFSDFISNFFKKRYLRLFPALSFALVFTFILLALFIPSSPSKDFYQLNLTGLSAIFAFLIYFFNVKHLTISVILLYNFYNWSLSRVPVLLGLPVHFPVQQIIYFQESALICTCFHNVLSFFIFLSLFY